MASFVLARHNYEEKESNKVNQMEVAEEFNWKHSVDRFVTGLLRRPSIQDELSVKVDYNIHAQSLIFKSGLSNGDCCNGGDNGENFNRKLSDNISCVDDKYNKSISYSDNIGKHSSNDNCSSDNSSKSRNGCAKLSNGVKHSGKECDKTYCDESVNDLNCREYKVKEVNGICKQNGKNVYNHLVCKEDTSQKIASKENTGSGKSIVNGKQSDNRRSSNSDQSSDKSSDGGICSRSNGINSSSRCIDAVVTDRCNPGITENCKTSINGEIHPITRNTCASHDIGEEDYQKDKDEDEICEIECDSQGGCIENNNTIRQTSCGENDNISWNHFNIESCNSNITLEKSEANSCNGSSTSSSDSSCGSVSQDESDGADKKTSIDDKQLFEKGLELFNKFRKARSRTNSNGSIGSTLSNGSYTNNNNICIINGIRYNAECMRLCKTERFIVKEGGQTDADSLFPVHSDLDISTGHLVLEYMEDHLANQERLNKEWEDLCKYAPDAPYNSTSAAEELLNARKNRTSCAIPYDHTRVRLDKDLCVSHSDYINAAHIKDHDPRRSCYIATQGPLPHTVADFWQMIWEQECSVIVNLTPLMEDGVTKCHQYWPQEGCDLYHVYEVHLVSEHIHCYNDEDDSCERILDVSITADILGEQQHDGCVIRSFFLKNIRTGGTRTVTQYHYTSWPDHGVPASANSLLDFRRKVKKSQLGMSSPILVHSSGGAGRTGTYCLLDLVLNRLSKGVKEMDISATLEHLRDQYMGLVETREQFEFALLAVAQEVENSIKSTQYK